MSILRVLGALDCNVCLEINFHNNHPIYLCWFLQLFVYFQLSGISDYPHES